MNLYPTIACDAKNDNQLRKSSELSIKDFYCVFVRTEIDLIAFSGPRNCVSTQYAALSGAMSTVKPRYIAPYKPPNSLTAINFPCPDFRNIKFPR